MSTRLGIFGALGVILFWAAFTAPPVAAQEGGAIPVPAGEVSAGYTFMRFFEEAPNGDSGVNFPAGWHAGAAANLNHWLAVAGEATGSYKNNLFEFNGEGTSSHVDASMFTLMVGPRFFSKRGRVSPFGQFLMGAAHVRANANFVGFGMSNTSTETETRFAIQPGGGVLVYLTDSVGVRAAADFRTVFWEEDSSNAFAFSTGMTFHWGRR